MQLLDRLNIDAEVLDSLDGRKLAPYQAAMRRDDWQKIQDQVADILVSQRQAYRRMFRGSGSPAILEAQEPRFSDEVIDMALADVSTIKPRSGKVLSSCLQPGEHGSEVRSYKEDCERSATWDLAEFFSVPAGGANNHKPATGNCWPIGVDQLLCAPAMLHGMGSSSLLRPLKLGRSATGVLQVLRT